MNIKEAKNYIKDSVKIYLKKDEYGDYRIPVMRQRPIFLLGAPGIGKTAIMEQIASELGIALVSYSMTHHTRQSALGLPFISEKEYAGSQYSVSEYTMSEIISTIYETMEISGVKEGILFLDEINCVSETLAPSMLQFLQYKVFGRHRVPDGWVIVTAGNPPEYNKSVREFDVVTMDRLKVLNVTADYETWKSYAKDKGIHASILNFLDIKKKYFYHMETTPEGSEYVTARGWEDLSEVITLYEDEGMKVSENLVGQYLHNDKIVREYTAYYDLFNKYKQDYHVEELLEGKHDAIIEKAKNAEIDERLSLTGILIDRVMEEMKDIMLKADAVKEMFPGMKRVKESDDPQAELIKLLEARKTIIFQKEKAGALSIEEKKHHRFIQQQLEVYIEKTSQEDAIASIVAELYNETLKAIKAATNKEKERLHNLFSFADKAFGANSNEMLVVVTQLTVGNDSARFLSSFGQDDYNHYNELLMISSRKEVLREDIAKLIEL